MNQSQQLDALNEKLAAATAAYNAADSLYLTEFLANRLTDEQQEAGQQKLAGLRAHADSITRQIRTICDAEAGERAAAVAQARAASHEWLVKRACDAKKAADARASGAARKFDKAMKAAAAAAEELNKAGVEIREAALSVIRGKDYEHGAHVLGHSDGSVFAQAAALALQRIARALGVNLGNYAVFNICELSWTTAEKERSVEFAAGKAAAQVAVTLDAALKYKAAPELTSEQRAIQIAQDARRHASGGKQLTVEQALYHPEETKKSPLSGLYE